MAQIYYSKMNISNVYEKAKNNDDIDLFNDVLKKIYNNMKVGITVDDEEDENVYYYLSSIEHNYSLKTVSGRLLKVEKSKDVETVDPSEDEVSTRSITNAFSSIAFSFQVYNEILVFVPKINFKKDDFHHYFSKILLEIAPEAELIDFKLMMDKESFNKKLKQIEKTTYASFIFIKPNGVNDDTIDDIANILTDSKATEASVDLKGSKKEPLDKNSKVFKMFIDYISKGWGYIKITGYPENQRKSIKIDTSKELMKKESISENNKDSHKFIENKIFGKDD